MQPLKTNKIINSLNSDKTTGRDGIPVKFIKLSANVIGSHLTNITNKDIDLNSFTGYAKITKVRPKKMIENYRPVSLLIYFPKFMIDLYMKI